MLLTKHSQEDSFDFQDTQTNLDHLNTAEKLRVYDTLL